MAAKVYSRHGGTAGASFDDLTDTAPFFASDGTTPLIQLGMSCQNGAATLGSFLVVDPTDNYLGVGGLYVPAHTLIRWTEDASGPELWLAQGRVSGEEMGRDVVLAGDWVEHTVQVEDANVDLRGLAFTEDWERPAETDTARLYALQAYILNGNSSTSPTKRPSTTITISSTHLAPNTNTQEMPAKTYPAGTQPNEIVDECALNAGKVYGVVIHHTGGSHLCLLYTKETDHSTYASTVKISDRISDWDPEDLSAPVFEPHWIQGKGNVNEGQSSISGLVSRYGTGTNFVYVNNPTQEANYETWIDSFSDADATDVSQATLRATAIRDYRASGTFTYRVSVIVLPEQVGLLAAGMSIQIDTAVIIGDGIRGTWYDVRIATLSWEPLPDGRYWAHMELGRAFRSLPSRGKLQPEATATKVCNGIESSCIDTFTRIEGSDWGTSTILCLPWHASSNGSHYVDGNVANTTAGGGSNQPTDWLTLTQWTGTDLEFLVKVKLGLSNGMLIIIGKQNGDDGEGGPFFDPSPRFTWDMGFDGSGDGGVQISAYDGNAFAISSAATALNGMSGDYFWARCRLETEYIRIKVWADGAAEPGGYTLSATPGSPGVAEFLSDTIGLGAADTFAFRADDGVSYRKIDYLQFVAGVACDSVLCDVCGLTGGPDRTPGTSQDAAPIDHNHDSVDNGDTAGGDLSGTYPNPTVSKIEGVDISSTDPVAGQFLIATSASAAAWSDPNVEDFYTAETDTALVLHPDGVGGIAWGTDATGGGGGDHDHTGAGDGGTLTDAVVDSFLEFVEAAGPADPASASTRLFAPTTATGSNTRLQLKVSDTNQPALDVMPLGFSVYAYPIGGGPTDLATTTLTLAANGGSVAVPIHIQTYMNFDRITVRNTDTANPRSIEFGIYYQEMERGDSVNDPVLTQVAGASGSVSFTPSAASNRQALGGTLLMPGIYWLVIRNTHASNTFGVGTEAAGTMALNTAQTKTLSSALGSTLDFTAATWTKITNLIGVRIEGSVFGTGVF